MVQARSRMLEMQDAVELGRRVHGLNTTKISNLPAEPAKRPTNDQVEPRSRADIANMCIDTCGVEIHMNAARTTLQ